MSKRFYSGMLQRVLLAVLLSIPAAGQTAPGAAGTGVSFYLSPSGNDAWSGKLPLANAARSDGPFQSLAGARDAIRRWRSTGGTGPVTVHVQGGMYLLASPFVLEPQDSGTPDAPVVYTAEPGETPLLDGGRRIQGWRRNGSVWEASLPEVRAGRWSFNQLFVNGSRRQRARSPNHGYFRIAELLPGPMDLASKRAVRRDGFRFEPGDLKPYARLSDVDIVLMHSWESSIHPIRSIDTVSNVVRFAAPLKEWWSIGYWEKAQRYYVENALELLDEPGEWYLSRETGLLTYWPMPGEEMDQVQVTAPVLHELVRLESRSEQGEFIHDVVLRGLHFQDSDWVLDPRGNSSTQAAVEVPAALTADGALRCGIEECEVAHVGTYGIWLRRGCRECRVSGNRLFDLGAGGIRVGEATMAKTDEAESNHNLVDGNVIFDGGHVYAAGVGIWVAQSSHNRISHNEIHDLLYSGMSIGWNWNDATNRTHDNLIEFNHIHDLGHGVLSDAGLIYCLGASPGSVIRNNLLHDMWPYSTPPFGWGIYFDATCSGFLCESNVVYNTRSGGVFWNNGGHGHVIRNNIFALSTDAQIWPFWPVQTNIFERNVIYFTRGPLFVSHAEATLQERRRAGQSLGTWENNVYWRTTDPTDLLFFKHRFGEWQAFGLDQHSVIADPRFVDPGTFDFRLRPESPALALGFHQIDLRSVGPISRMK